MKTGEEIIVQVDKDGDGQRLDSFLAFRLQEEVSRSSVKHWIKVGAVSLQKPDTNPNASGTTISIKPSRTIKEKDIITIKIPEPAKNYSLEPYEIDIPVLYEDDDIAVIIKPAGIAVHPGPGHPDKTLVNALVHNLNGLKNMSAGSENFRPGIVNRLDLPTYGLMPIAKNNNAHRHLAAAFAERKVDKYYKAITVGRPPDKEGKIKLPIGRHPVLRHKMTVREDGKEATTLYKLLHSWATEDGRVFSFFDLQILTGRTHQIRVHLHSLGCAIIGDNFYSRNYRKYGEQYGLLLACTAMNFDHPITGKKMKFNIDIPDTFKDFLRKKSAAYEFDRTT